MHPVKMDFYEYVPKFLKLDISSVLLTEAQIKFLTEKYVNHKSEAEIAFTHSIRYSIIKAVIARGESHILRYAIYMGEC